MTTQITAQSLALFLAYANDAGNWSGNPLVGGNVGGSKEDRGNLTQLKRAGLLTTHTDKGCTWITFTEEGKALARAHGNDDFYMQTKEEQLARNRARQTELDRAKAGA